MTDSDKEKSYHVDCYNESGGLVCRYFHTLRESRAESKRHDEAHIFKNNVLKESR